MQESQQFVIGLLVTVVLAVFILRRWMRKNAKLKEGYDERQQIVLAKAYSIGFQAMCLLGVCYIVLQSLLPSLPVQPSLAIFAILMVSISASSCYRIMNDAFFMMGQRGKTYIIILAIVTVLELWLAFDAVRNGTLIENGELAFNAGFSFILVVCFGAILTCIGIKRLRDRGED